FYAAAANIMAEFDQFFSEVHIYLQYRGIGTVEFNIGSVSDEFYATVLEKFSHSFTFRLTQRRFYSMLVFRAQFHTEKIAFLTVLNNCGDVPVFSPLVGDQPRFHL